jgi:hypothetical protein
MWSPGDFKSSGVRSVVPDLQDAVIVAALRRRHETGGVAA